MKRLIAGAAMLPGIAAIMFAQPLPREMHTQSASTVSLTAKGDEQTLAITNVAYEVTSDSVPGRPQGQRLLLRKTTTSQRVLGDKGEDATTTVEAWPLGADLKQTPLYTVKAPGVGAEVVDFELISVDRGLDEVQWWSIYRLGNGRHLFDTYVPLVTFSISREVLEARYIGLEVPPDDTPDPRLKRPEVVAVISYASPEQVKREALLTCDIPKRAAELRSFSDTARKVAVDDDVPPHAVKIEFRIDYSHPQPPVIVAIPVLHDDLDIAHAQLPPHLHLSAWKR